MKLITLSRRTAAAGAASDLVAGALVGATATVAEAAPVQNTYSCNNGLIGTFPVVLDSDAPGIESVPGAPAGFSVPAQLLSVTNTFTIPAEVRDTLAGAGIEDLSFPDYAGTVGNSSIPVLGVTAKVSEMTDNADGTYSVDATDGLNDTFDTPRAGTFDVLSPAAFTIIGDFGGSPIPVDCVIAEGTQPGAYSSLVITKNDSATAAKAVNAPVKKGTVAKVKVKVTAPNEKPGGKVLLKKDKKTVAQGNLNKKGVVVLKTKSLPKGKNKLTALYKGDGYTNKSKDGVVVKVVR